MRDIKFRVWDKKINKMTVQNGSWSIDSNFKTLNFFLEDVEDDGLDERFVLLQYTGLKDKNGVEIYEGDIVVSYVKGQQGTDTCVVVWKDGLAGWLLDTAFPGSIGTYQLNCHVSGLYVVIGNIYENGDLLNNEEQNK